MKQIIKTALCAIALSASLTGWAQSTDNNKFVVKAYANIGLGDAVKLNSNLPGISSSSSAYDYGVILAGHSGRNSVTVSKQI